MSRFIFAYSYFTSITTTSTLWPIARSQGEGDDSTGSGHLSEVVHLFEELRVALLLGLLLALELVLGLVDRARQPLLLVALQATQLVGQLVLYALQLCRLLTAIISQK